jgi:hypothetical protein
MYLSFSNQGVIENRETICSLPDNWHMDCILLIQSLPDYVFSFLDIRGEREAEETDLSIKTNRKK